MQPDPEPWAVFEKADPGWWRVSGDFPSVFVATAILDGRVRVVGVLAAEPEAGFNGFRDVPLARIEASLASSPQRVAWSGQQTQANSPVPLIQRLNVPADVNEQEYPRGRTGDPLQVPSRPVPDAFYQAVAQAYREFSSVTVRPVTEIAKEAEVGLRTAQGWVAEARRREYLPPGQRGRVM